MEVSEGPVLATVVPLLNEGEHVGSLLESLLDQTMAPEAHTVLLVDGGSTDNTLEVIETVLAQRSTRLPSVHLVHNPERTVAHARNLALSMLPRTVEFVVELLGHATIERTHLEDRMVAWQLAEHQAGAPLAGVGCKVEGLVGEQALVAGWIDAALASPLGQSDGQFSRFTAPGPTKVPAFVTHRRSALEAVGGWDTDLLTSQDSDLSMRLLKAGYALHRVPSPTVRMARRTTLRKWWKMGHRYGFWRTKVLLRHPSRLRWVEWLPWTGAVATALAYLTAAPLWWMGAAAYGCVLVAEGIRHVRSGPSYIVGVPLCLLMLHASFSLGLLDGFLRRGRPASDR